MKKFAKIALVLSFSFACANPTLANEEKDVSSDIDPSEVSERGVDDWFELLYCQTIAKCY
ncbi:hypothetical protein [Bowmanella dokdonensis]|uniref:Uncharacterized protein n=1 Tax=Bowmanella dokdonensis TaxID=751969 RepID=A0A939DKN6_9ALTE|nr:hypothetical protein [Bowmanella dokdonensis]MBN7823930.1 hypothetical protein [Bowmanella dokdonensis]